MPDLSIAIAGLGAIGAIGAGMLAEIARHDRKSVTSYFGGTVKSFEVVETDNARTKRIVFKLIADREAKGVEWSGRSDVNAHFSGLVPD